MSNAQDILKQLGIEEIDNSVQKYYSIIIYGKSGTGKTTIATRENNAFIIDINEDGTQVTEQGFVKSAKDYQAFKEAIVNIEKIVLAGRAIGKKVDVIVIETAQKLREITLNYVLAKHKKKVARIQDYGETAKLVTNMIRYLLGLKNKLGVHIILTGHEGINGDDKNEDGNIINPRVSIELQNAIHSNLVTQFDIIGRSYIDEFINEQGVIEQNYIFSVEPSKLYTTKVRHSPNIKISNPKINNASISEIVEMAKNGN